MTGTRISGRVAMVTGASRGIGAEFVRQLLERGAAKVYAAVRDPKTVADLAGRDPRVVPLRLDVTDPVSVAEAAAAARDVTVLVNNAGLGGGGSMLDPDDSHLRALMETNFYGPVRVTAAFAPAIVAAGGGAVVNVVSVLSWTALGSGYSASKAALWSATGSQRLELASRGVQVVGLHMGYVDTDMTAGITEPKSTREQIVTQALDGMEAGALEVVADELSRHVRASLSAPVEEQYPALAR
jgi:NAD(P)-dependent dehydrogenase (short-subunit alcohol dehydrogenase family)